MNLEKNGAPDIPAGEEVLREFAEGLGVPVADSYIAASAAKLRLAGGEDA